MSENTPRQRVTTVSVLPMPAGGCGACHQSIAALLAGRHANKLTAQGITFARSPRHADILLITGPLTHAARDEARAYIEAGPQPRALVAVGNCAIDGCVFRGSPHLVANPSDELDVNVEIAGCPPAPTAILAAIAEASELIASAITGDDTPSTAQTSTATETDEEAQA